MINTYTNDRVFPQMFSNYLRSQEFSNIKQLKIKQIHFQNYKHQMREWRQSKDRFDFLEQNILNIMHTSVYIHTHVQLYVFYVSC